MTDELLFNPNFIEYIQSETSLNGYKSYYINLTSGKTIRTTYKVARELAKKLELQKTSWVEGYYLLDKITKYKK